MIKISNIYSVDKICEKNYIFWVIITLSGGINELV